MEIILRELKVDAKTVNPTLVADVLLEFPSEMEAPLFISGHICTSDGYKIALLNENSTSGTTHHPLYILTDDDREKRHKENRLNRYACELTAELSSKTIEHIETLREKDSGKDVRFVVKLMCRYLEGALEASLKKDVSQPLSRVRVTKADHPYEIEHSKWIKEFAPKLGIGKFLLLELQIPENKKVPEFWKKLYEQLSKNTQDMEMALRGGDWEKSMLHIRKFYENAKIGDNKPGHKQHKEKFTALLENDGHDKEGIDNFYDGIWQFFEFFSKYIHDQDKKGNISERPHIHKEDAYFAYSMAVGLLNFIGRKISE